jgi:hypothetical protein
MDFIPFNRFIRVIPMEEDVVEESPMIIMPEDFQRQLDPYLVCEVLEVSQDVKLELHVGTKIIIERRMLNEINVKGKTIYLVLENYVYGRIDND